MNCFRLTRDEVSVIQLEATADTTDKEKYTSLGPSFVFFVAFTPSVDSISRCSLGASFVFFVAFTPSVDSVSRCSILCLFCRLHTLGRQRQQVLHPLSFLSPSHCRQVLPSSSSLPYLTTSSNTLGSIGTSVGRCSHSVLLVIVIIVSNLQSIMEHIPDVHPPSR